MQLKIEERTQRSDLIDLKSVIFCGCSTSLNDVDVATLTCPVSPRLPMQNKEINILLNSSFYYYNFAIESNRIRRRLKSKKKANAKADK